MLFLASVDVSVGRVDKASCSQATLMELVIGNVENKESIMGTREKPPKDWNGLFTDSNDPESITTFMWSFIRIRGSIALEWLPPTVDACFLDSNSLTGTVNLSCLPDVLRVLDIRGNRLTGSLDLAHLPASVEDLCLSENRFSGSVCLTHLPSGMCRLDISKNELGGCVDLSQLPSKMTTLSLNDNLALRGEIDFTDLPESLREFDVSNTQLWRVSGGPRKEISGSHVKREDQFW
mmetsp:Transcript_22236/g.34540  ORF Transcript_22236/g.34540 Transcript_22236/m.34540 type:complete len:235 (-) Transcript_22236:46-750(-)